MSRLLTEDEQATDFIMSASIFHRPDNCSYSIYTYHVVDLKWLGIIEKIIQRTDMTKSLHVNTKLEDHELGYHHKATGNRNFNQGSGTHASDLPGHGSRS